MVVETATGAAATGYISEAAFVEADEATTIERVVISGAIELSETLSAIQKEVPREVINEKVDAMLQDPAFRDRILEETKQIFTINEQLEGSLHPETNVSFISKEVEVDGESRIGVFPDFSEHTSYETHLIDDQYKASDYQQSKYCNGKLSQAYENGSLNTEQFTDRQLDQIRNGDKPEGYTWHHYEDQGRMQLVDSEIHAKTPHTGGRSIWGGGSEAR